MLLLLLQLLLLLLNNLLLLLLKRGGCALLLTRLLLVSELLQWGLLETKSKVVPILSKLKSIARVSGTRDRDAGSLQYRQARSARSKRELGWQEKLVAKVRDRAASTTMLAGR